MSEGNVGCRAKQVLRCKQILKRSEMAQNGAKTTQFSGKTTHCYAMVFPIALRQIACVCCFQMQHQSQLASLEATAKQNAEDAQRIRRERDEALREVQHLKKLLKKKEEEYLTAEEELMKARRVRCSIIWQGSLEVDRSVFIGSFLVGDLPYGLFLQS